MNVLDFLLDYCEAHHLKDDNYNESIALVVQEAADYQNIKMVKLLVAKCKALNTGCALSIAVRNDDVEMLKTVIVGSSSNSIQDTLVKAAVTKREKLLEILLEHANADTVEHALIRVDVTAVQTATSEVRC